MSKKTRVEARAELTLSKGSVVPRGKEVELPAEVADSLIARGQAVPATESRQEEAGDEDELVSLADVAERLDEAPRAVAASLREAGIEVVAKKPNRYRRAEVEAWLESDDAGGD